MHTALYTTGNWQVTTNFPTLSVRLEIRTGHLRGCRRELYHYTTEPLPVYIETFTNKAAIFDYDYAEGKSGI